MTLTGEEGHGAWQLYNQVRTDPELRTRSKQRTKTEPMSGMSFRFVDEQTRHYLGQMHENGPQIIIDSKEFTCSKAMRQRLKEFFREVRERGEAAGKSDLPWVHSEIDTAGVSGGWRFVFGSYEEIGLPVTAFLTLYAVRDDEVKEIQTFQDLEELEGLRIEDAQGALALVRLLTAEETYVVFEVPLAVEVETESATVSENDIGFLVKRHLVFDSAEFKSAYGCFEVTEQISRDGKYEVIEKRFLRDVSIGDFPRGEYY
ncbi:hypothetical protein [Aeoliella sp.]|uniref:hypothetical protein n=1 Tax=Aeoliella sp. TaxID=2795800 RepID=UPI003CCB9737